MKDGRLVVMQVVTNLDIGGAQEVVRTLAENMEKVGCRSVVCAFKDGPLRAGIERLGVPVVILPSRKHGVTNPLFFLLELLRARRLLLGLVKIHNVDVIQTHILRSLDFLVLSLRLQSDVRVFWIFHNERFDLREEHLGRQKWLLEPKLWGYHTLYRIGARWANRLVAVSEQVKSAMLKTMPHIHENRIAVVCNSVDVTRYGDRTLRSILRRELGIGDHDRVVAMVATFKEQKGHRFLLDALPSVMRQFPDLHVLLIGDGALRLALEAQARNLKLDERVHFLGSRNDVPDLLSASDLFILPSLWEGLPMALVEAMASGLPAIGTRVAGTNQVMAHGETGLLVTPGSADELCEAMLELLSSPERMDRMGRAARQRVEVHFGAVKQAREYLALFESGMKQKTRNQRGEEVASSLRGSH